MSEKSQAIWKEKQEAVKKAASTAEKKNRRTAVYLYLLILFGAALLMLLLACFVQLRDNDTTAEYVYSVGEPLEQNAAGACFTESGPGLHGIEYPN